MKETEHYTIVVSSSNQDPKNQTVAIGIHTVLNGKVRVWNAHHSHKGLGSSAEIFAENGVDIETIRRELWDIPTVTKVEINKLE